MANVLVLHRFGGEDAAGRYGDARAVLIVEMARDRGLSVSRDGTRTTATGNVFQVGHLVRGLHELGVGALHIEVETGEEAESLRVVGRFEYVTPSLLKEGEISDWHDQVYVRRPRGNPAPAAHLVALERVA